MHRILVVGTGSIGERHVRCMQATQRARVGICEKSETLLDEVARRYGIADAYPSLDAALNEPWDGAVVATPAPLHIPMARQLVQQGIPVLIEKPLSVSMDGVEALLDEAAKHKTPVGVAYVYRAHPALAAMKQALDAGKFGRILEVYSTGGHDFAAARPAYREIYYADRAMGGGAIQDALTHIINACEWLAGPIGRLAVDADHVALEGVDVEDTVHAIARHGGTPASYCLNQYQTPYELLITVVCERGTARFDLGSHAWRWAMKPTGEWVEEYAEGISERDDWFRKQEAAFLDVLDGNARPLCTLEEGAQSLAVNLAALASMELNAWQEVRAPAGSGADAV